MRETPEAPESFIRKVLSALSRDPRRALSRLRQTFRWSLRCRPLLSPRAGFGADAFL